MLFSIFPLGGFIKTPALGYVHIDDQQGLLVANRAALEILGVEWGLRKQHTSIS